MVGRLKIKFGSVIFVFLLITVSFQPCLAVDNETVNPLSMEKLDVSQLFDRTMLKEKIVTDSEYPAPPNSGSFTYNPFLSVEDNNPDLSLAQQNTKKIKWSDTTHKQVIDVIKNNRTKKMQIIDISQFSDNDNSVLSDEFIKSGYADSVILKINFGKETETLGTSKELSRNSPFDKTSEKELIKRRALQYKSDIKSVSEKIKQKNPDIKIGMYIEDVLNLTTDLDLVTISGKEVTLTEDFDFVVNLNTEISKNLDFVVIEKNGMYITALPAILPLVPVAGLMLIDIMLGMFIEIIVDTASWCSCERFDECYCEQEVDCGKFAAFLYDVLSTILTAGIKLILKKTLEFVLSQVLQQAASSISDPYTNPQAYWDSFSDDAATLNEYYPELLTEMDENIDAGCLWGYNPGCGLFYSFWDICLYPVILSKAQDKDILRNEFKKQMEGSIGRLNVQWNIDKKTLRPGETATITYSLEGDPEWGTSYDVNCRDIIPSQFSLVSGNNYTYYSSIKPGESKSFSYTIQANQQGVYNLHRTDLFYSIKVSYKDSYASGDIFREWYEGPDVPLSVNPSSCGSSADCAGCQKCINNRCQQDDLDPNGKCSGQCCGGVCQAKAGICCGGPTFYTGENACCDSLDCSINSQCINHICLMSDGASCTSSRECASGNCAGCSAIQPHCCPAGMQWDGQKCSDICYQTCAETKCMPDYNGNTYSCNKCTPTQIQQGLCEQSSGGCYYGDPDATNSPCTRCSGECVNGYCENLAGCIENKLPDTHGYIDCQSDPTINCDCQDTCNGAVRFYNGMNFILPGDTGYVNNGCIYHGCYNCAQDDRACLSGSCVSGSTPSNWVYDADSCPPDTTIRENIFRKANPSYPSLDKCPFIWDIYRDECIPSSMKYYNIGDSESYCLHSPPASTAPLKINDQRWRAGKYYYKMKNYPWINQKICYEEKTWGCFEDTEDYVELYECRSPVPSDFLLCGTDCYNPTYYECCGGEYIRLKDVDGDGIQDRQCCIKGIENHQYTNPFNQQSLRANVVIYDKLGDMTHILEDPQNCGACGWNCTATTDGACTSVARDYAHVCSGTTPQCCKGSCIEPSPVISVSDIAFYSGIVTEGAEETIQVTVNYADPYLYGKKFEGNLSLYINNSFGGSQTIALDPNTQNTAQFFWRVNRVPGSYEIKAVLNNIHNNSACGKFFLSEMFTVIKKGDISVDSVAINSQNIHSGDIVPLTAKIKNFDTNKTNEFIVILDEDGSTASALRTSLNGNETKSIKFNWTAKLGDHNLTIKVDAIPPPSGIIPETNEQNNTKSLYISAVQKGTSAPSIRYVYDKGYFFDAVEPDSGNTSTLFEYRINYLDYDNDAPAVYSPLVWIDVNGDGDYSDTFGKFSEGNFTMKEVISGDLLFTDGKYYSYSTYLPVSLNSTYRFTGRDVTGFTATGITGLFSGPVVSKVQSPPVNPFPGYTNPPTDPDSDGIYEDLNANNRLDFADIVLYFMQMEWIAANEPIAAFDLNYNNRIDFADIVSLFGEI